MHLSKNNLNLDLNSRERRSCTILEISCDRDNEFFIVCLSCEMLSYFVKPKPLALWTSYQPIGNGLILECKKDSVDVIHLSKWIVMVEVPTSTSIHEKLNERNQLE